ncbi:DUF4381 domain-containing protein [uncultured Ferrimonas sp.]|uniref:DUF4381 domain-containing protein n=1 Tax=uncultured Ferrimonas sp. TaxID=432640 RepID=UPI0026217090|nr:DUF4381 domain-containing protein [uncultured Ferrimonas sp.]
MNPLQQLQDITLPAAVTAFPWAWGWWLLLCCALAGFIALGWYWQRQRQRNRFAVLAQQQLQQLDSSQAQFGQQISELLKQTLAAYGQRQHTAALHSQQWHQQLNQLHRADWSALLGNPYQAESQHGGEALRQAARAAIKQIAQGGHHA